MKKVLGILVVYLMLGMVFVGGISFRGAGDADVGYDDSISAVSKQKVYPVHDPIYINGNSDFNYENGVVSGSGTEGEPYIIENYDINASSAKGIEIRNTDKYFIIRNCCIHDGGIIHYHEGIYFSFVEHGTIESVTSYNNYHGIYLKSSSNNSITDCTTGWSIVHSHAYGSGIYLYSSSNNQITNCNAYNNYYEGIYLSVSSNNNTITNCATYNNSHNGIDLYSSSNNNQIINCNVYNNYDGVTLASSSNNQISNCNVYNNDRYGINLYSSSSNNSISDCTVHNNSYLETWAYGIKLSSSSNNNIMTNITVYNNSNVGIWLDDSSNNIITGTTAYNNLYGIDLHSSNTYNIISDCTVYNNSHYGIYLMESSNNNTIINCDVYNNDEYGIWLAYSSNNSISDCAVYNNTHEGIHLSFTYNQITNTTVYNNLDGICLGYSSYNQITNTSIYSNSRYGIYLNSSSNYNHQIYHNNFINNGYLNAYDPFSDYGENYWDNGYPSGGNYWSDYTGVDEYSGVDQDIYGSDGIGDAPYNIPASSDQDHYPLMSPVGGVVNQRPTCTITSPSPDTTLSGTITVEGTASDPDGNVESVQVSIDDNTFSSGLLTVTGTTSWSAEWDTTTVSNGSHTIYARSYDGTDYSNIDSVTVTVNNVAGADTTPPTITHTPIVSAEEEKPITITATITDDVGVTSATLYYRKTGETNYTTIAMAKQSGNTWAATIPGSAITIPGVEYYISATDGTNTATHPATNPTTSPHAITVTQLVTETVEDPATGATVTAQYTGTGNITITSVSSPGAPPSGVHGINIFVEITVTDTMTIQWAYIVVPYNEDDLPSGVDESKLRLFYWTDTGWEKCENTNVDTVNNVVYANVTHFTIFAPMAEKAAAEEGVNWLLYSSIGVIVAVMVAGAVIVMKKKKKIGKVSQQGQK